MKHDPRHAFEPQPQDALRRHSGAAPRDGDPSPEMLLRSVIAALLRRRRVVMTTAVLVLAALALAAMTLERRYTATALVAVDPRETQLTGVNDNFEAFGMNMRVDTQTLLLQSPKVLHAAARALNLASDPEFGLRPSLRRSIEEALPFIPRAEVNAAGRDARLVRELKRALEVSRERMTSVISVSASSRDPKKAALIANTVVDAFLNEAIAEGIESRQRATRYLEQRVQALAEDIRVGEEALARFVEMNPIAAGQDQAAGNSTGPEPDASVPVAVSQELFRLRGDVARSHALYNTYAARLRDVQQQTGIPVTNAHLVSPAFPPDQPAFPPLALILVASVGLAGAAGAGAGLLRDRFVGGFTSAEQAEAVLGVPCGAVVPRISEDPHLSFVQRPLSAFSEAIRRARLSIADRLPSRPGRLVLVTSTRPGEGKTSISVALAQAFVSSGQRTLLIDADLRHPTVHRYLGQASDIGLLKGAEADGTEDDLLKAFAYHEPSKLHFVADAQPSQLSSDLILESQEFRDLLERSRGMFDIVVMDSPPADLVVDARILSRHADLVVCILRYGASQQTEVGRSIRELREAAPDTPIVTLLNMGEDELSLGAIGLKDRKAKYYDG